MISEKKKYMKRSSVFVHLFVYLFFHPIFPFIPKFNKTLVTNQVHWRNFRFLKEMAILGLFGLSPSP